jgi:alpha-ketoglutarate-dependent taurine dioxygenase
MTNSLGIVVNGGLAAPGGADERRSEMTTLRSLRETRSLGLDVEPLTVHIGAVIGGVDLSQDLGDEVIAEIRTALLRHRVVFFRNQCIDSSDHLAFAQRFGRLTAGHPTIPPVAGAPNLYDLDSLRGVHADQWHTDVTFVDQPPDFSFLRTVVLPHVGGDTLWASTVAGYERLRPELRRLAEQLRVIHTNNYDYARLDIATADGVDSLARESYVKQFVSTVYETEHPLVRDHPETGERALLLGGFAQRIVGYTTAESVDLLRLFQSYVVAPEQTVRWRWRDGDVAIWDNRSTEHYAAFDYGDTRRQVQRVTTVGSVPVGVDGRPSRPLRGDSGPYNGGTA